MEKFRQHYSASVMNVITLSLAAIIGVGLFTIFASFWMTELADKDTQAINLSGSLRMQTYHVGLTIQRRENQQALAYIDKLDSTWHHSLFALQSQSDSTNELNTHFKQAHHHWTEVLRPHLLQLIQQPGTTTFPNTLIEKQVDLNDQLVNQYQQAAETKIRGLRIIQLFALFVTVGVGSMIFYLIKNRIEKPLLQLTHAAHRIGKGDFEYRVNAGGRDELGLLGAVINQMGSSLGQMYKQMDERVKQRTQELRRNNIALEFLFNTARKTLDAHNTPLDYQELLDELTHVIKGNVSLELCLFTTEGDRPYLQVAPHPCSTTDCTLRSCDDCHGDAPFHPLQNIRLNEKFPIIFDDSHYGVISVRSPNMTPLPVWQEQLLHSVADQFALALSLAEQKRQERRLAMLNERTVIARELHDSLAQALSYLQIQATRLQKSKDKKRYDLQQPIIDELREGLSSAYRQLRELLTTFRLKMDAGGLHTALQQTVEKLRERTDMDVELHYELTNLPLSPTEEIHLLQIIREASQNAVNHSQGTQVDIFLRPRDDKSIELIVDDDGIGIPAEPGKINHYGLNIMNERSRHLGGEVSIEPRAEGGTRVAFNFQPSFLSGVR